jgi:hypothetical protein
MGRRAASNWFFATGAYGSCDCDFFFWIMGADNEQQCEGEKPATPVARCA